MYNTTIKELIDKGKELRMTTNDLSFKTVLTNSIGEMFVVNMNLLFEKYYELLTDHTVIVTLSENEYLRYRYKPKLLSKDLYGTYDLHFLLLKLNHITSVVNFDFTELKVFNTNIIGLLNEIQVLENDNFIDNEMEVIKKINE